MDNYVQALRKVPECRLAILELTRRFTRPDGTLDDEGMSRHTKQIQTAIEEARTYSTDTQRAVKLLWRLLYLRT